MCAHSNNPKHILNTPGSNKTSMKDVFAWKTFLSHYIT
uniref:Uncharacterized protein n=1 Tax=Anguilla anguilla TaxID=7936 RepID=A0A0E9Q2S2_ANGAN